MQTQLQNYIKAGYGALSMTTAEYFRCMNDIIAVTNSMAGTLGSWDARGKVSNMLTGSTFTEDLYQPEEFFEWVRGEIASQDEEERDLPHLWIVNDFHMFMKNPDPALMASFRDAVRDGGFGHHHFILIGATTQLSPEIEKLVTPIEYELPTKEEIYAMIKGITDNHPLVNVSDEDVGRAVIASAGMTSTEVEDSVSLSLTSCNGKLY